MVALGLSPFPPFLLMCLGQRMAAGHFGDVSLWASLGTVVGAVLGLILSLLLIGASGVIADIKAHEMWLAMRQRLENELRL